MTHRLKFSVSVPDDVYENVILPARKSNSLGALIVSSLTLYDKSPQVRSAINSDAGKSLSSDIEDLFDSINAGLGAASSDLSGIATEGEAGKRAAKHKLDEADGNSEGDTKGAFTSDNECLKRVESKLDQVLWLMKSVSLASPTATAPSSDSSSAPETAEDGMRAEDSASPVPRLSSLSGAVRGANTDSTGISESSDSTGIVNESAINEDYDTEEEAEDDDASSALNNLLSGLDL